MKLRRQQKAGFWFTTTETFKLKFPNSVSFSGKSVNDILYFWTSPSPVLQANAIFTRSATKRVRSNHESSDVLDNESSQADALETGSQLPYSRFISPSISTTPLSCTSQDLWHLRFGHASSTTLRKLRYIKSNFDSVHCITCIRAKKARKSFRPSKRKVSRKLE
jgi:hypothetical protein